MAFQEKNREQSLESSAPRVLRSGEPKEVTRSTPSIKGVLPTAEPGQSHEYNIGTRGGNEETNKGTLLFSWLRLLCEKVLGHPQWISMGCLVANCFRITWVKRRSCFISLGCVQTSLTKSNLGDKGFSPAYYSRLQCTAMDKSLQELQSYTSHP